MIEQVLQDVKQTEEQAAAILSSAEEKAAAIRLATESAIAGEWEQVKSRAKSSRVDRLEQAKVEAEQQTANIRSRNDALCRDLQNKTQGKIDAAVQQLTERIFHGDC